MMAVSPAQQGRGLGSALLRRVLALTADAPGGAEFPTVLTTHQQRNVAFYLQAGFAVVEKRELDLNGKSAPYPVWGMQRDRA
jgi:GNAT superfamily N-acetyltransferase